MSKTYDVVVIGGGQSGLAVGYFLRRTGLNYLILDAQKEPGGAWQHGWDSLRLFSPAEHSSLPGWLMPKDVSEYPSKDHVINYLKQYEDRYKLNIKRPIDVLSIEKKDDTFQIKTENEVIYSKAIVSATGTWNKPFIPKYQGYENYSGLKLHSAHYQNPDNLDGKKVLIIGGGNSGAQVLAEVSKVAETTWVTLNEPVFLPDDVDGRYLFEFATRQYKAKLEGKKIEPVGSLGDVVMVEPVKEARDRNVLISKRPFDAFYENGIIWQDGTKEQFDAVIWCTGFKSSLDHLTNLGVTKDGKIKTALTKAVDIKGLWLVGYGSWTGYASATLIGVGRTARQTVLEIEDYISEN